ncbi:hypothetical protein GCM10009747_13160 [Agromyces humatus]|uniref:Uncharacterized protein n=1 Tax=Agromyces humatus TaxID=279573 RepID=A0ABP4WJQ6_9MICO
MNDRSDRAVGWAGTGPPALGAVGGYVDMVTSFDPFTVQSSAVSLRVEGPAARTIEIASAGA